MSIYAPTQVNFPTASSCLRFPSSHLLNVETPNHTPSMCVHAMGCQIITTLLLAEGGRCVIKAVIVHTVDLKEDAIA